METGVKERIKSIMSFENLSGKAFSEKINVPRPTIVNMFNKDTKPSYDFIKSIAVAFPTYSLDWLIIGIGPMLKSEIQNTTAAVVQEEKEVGTPLLPVEAWGGSLRGSSIAILAEQCKKYNVPIGNIDYLIPIAGDSMLPEYCPGDVVAIKKVNERAFIEWGKVYVLDTCNGVIIKEVQPSDSEGCITCISHNAPTKYKPFEISLNPEEFYGMYAVKGTVRMS